VYIHICIFICMYVCIYVYIYTIYIYIYSPFQITSLSSRTSLCLTQTTRETGKKKSKIGHDEVTAATVKSFIMFARSLKRGRAVNLRFVVYRGCSSCGLPHRVKESSSERRRKARRDYSQLKYAVSRRHIVRLESSKRVRSLFPEAVHAKSPLRR